MSEEITLWFGNEGTHCDKFGNIYTIHRDTPNDKDEMKPEIVSMYQSVLRELGVSVNVNEYDEFDFKTGRMKHVVIHYLKCDGGYLPYLHKGFRYEETR